MLCCGSKKKQLPPLEDKEAIENIENAQEITGFSKDELNRYYYSFKNLANDGILDHGGFNKLMMLMGIRISKGIEARIFQAIVRTQGERLNKGITKGIDFPGLMMYFYNILSGSEESSASQKLGYEIKLWFLMLDSPNAKNYITGSDLENFLLDMEADEVADTEPEEAEENKEVITGLVMSIFHDMGKDYQSTISMVEFDEILRNNEDVLDIFRGFGSSIANLLDVQGQNKYSLTVRVLEEVTNKFKQFVIQSKEMKEAQAICEVLEAREREIDASYHSQKNAFVKKVSIVNLLDKRKKPTEEFFSPKNLNYSSKMSNAFQSGLTPVHSKGYQVKHFPTDPLESPTLHGKSGFATYMPNEKDMMKPKASENISHDPAKMKSSNYQVPVIEPSSAHGLSNPTDKMKSILQQEIAHKTSGKVDPQHPEVIQGSEAMEKWKKNKENFASGMEYLAYLSKLAAANPANNGIVSLCSKAYFSPWNKDWAGSW